MRGWRERSPTALRPVSSARPTRSRGPASRWAGSRRISHRHRSSARSPGTTCCRRRRWRHERKRWWIFWSTRWRGKAEKTDERQQENFHHHRHGVSDRAGVLSVHDAVEQGYSADGNRGWERSDHQPADYGADYQPERGRRLGGEEGRFDRPTRSERAGGEPGGGERECGEPAGAGERGEPQLFDDGRSDGRERRASSGHADLDPGAVGSGKSDAVAGPDRLRPDAETF